MSRPKLTWTDAAVALFLGVGFTLILVNSVGALGYARDEGFYFQAASAYGGWFQQFWVSPSSAMSQKMVDSAWSVNHEHPGFIKSLFALSNLILQKRFHLFAMEGTSFRFPAMVLGGMLLSTVYLWGTEVRSRAAGLSAAIFLGAMPRFFYHAHLACFDVPIVALWTLCAYTFWRSLKVGGALWPVLTGITFGIALNSKHNSWFLPIVASMHTAALWVYGAFVTRVERFRWAPTEATRRALLSLTCMALIGPLLMFAFWPWIWRDTFQRLSEYALFHLNHEYYNMELFGTNYWKPPMPRSYAFVMTAATVPLVTLLLFGAGLIGRVKGHGERASDWVSLMFPESRVSRYLKRFSKAERGAIAPTPEPAKGPIRFVAGAPERAKSRVELGTDLLWMLSIAAIYAAWLSPKTPIFGGTKHWMTAYPFLALFAGIAFDDLTRVGRFSLAKARRSVPGWLRGAKLPIVAAVLGTAVVASPIVQTVGSHPWGLSAYTPLVGGAAGAATLGLNRTFWGYTTGAVTDYLNASPKGSLVFVHDTAGASWEMLLTDGRLRKDLRGVGSIDAASLALYHHEKHMAGVEYQIWASFGTTRPDYIAGLNGVPVIWVYKRPEK